LRRILCVTSSMRFFDNRDSIQISSSPTTVSSLSSRSRLILMASRCLSYMLCQCLHKRREEGATYTHASELFSHFLFRHLVWVLRFFFNLRLWRRAGCACNDAKGLECSYMRVMSVLI
jgi:hypothetical protein